MKLEAKARLTAGPVATRTLQALIHLDQSISGSLKDMSEALHTDNSDVFVTVNDVALAAHKLKDEIKKAIPKFKGLKASTITAADNTLSTVSTAIKNLSHVRHDLDQLKRSLGDDDGRSELLRREIARIGDVLEGLDRITKIQVRSSTIDDAACVDTQNQGQLMGSTEDPLSDGVAFDTLIDGDPTENDPVVQEVTKDDGGVEKPAEQELLMDDIHPFSIQVG